MTTEKMNVHKALAELKILDDRIVKAINSVEACISNKHSNTKVKGVDIKVYTGVMKSCKFCSNGTPILKSAVHSF